MANVPLIVQGDLNVTGNARIPNRILFSVASNIPAANNSQQTYNKVNINIGSGFSTVTNRFTAPVSGTYYFEWSTIKQVSDTVNVHRQYIRVNGSNALDGRHLRLSETNNYGEGTCSAIITLNQNDYVDIYISNTGVGSHASYEYTWFHGYLIG